MPHYSPKFLSYPDSKLQQKQTSPSHPCYLHGHFLPSPGADKESLDPVCAPDNAGLSVEGMRMRTVEEVVLSKIVALSTSCCKLIIKRNGNFDLAPNSLFTGDLLIPKPRPVFLTGVGATWELGSAGQLWFAEEAAVIIQEQSVASPAHIWPVIGLKFNQSSSQLVRLEEFWVPSRTSAMRIMMLVVLHTLQKTKEET